MESTLPVHRRRTSGAAAPWDRRRPRRQLTLSSPERWGLRWRPAGPRVALRVEVAGRRGARRVQAAAAECVNRCQHAMLLEEASCDCHWRQPPPNAPFLSTPERIFTAAARGSETPPGDAAGTLSGRIPTMHEKVVL